MSLHENIYIARINKVSDLPGDWDALAGNYFRTSGFLKHCEKYNPCNQRYYLLYNKDNFAAGAIVYSLKLDVFTFSKFRLPIQMNIAGVPVSISAPGIFGDRQYTESLKEYICRNEKGFTLFLNLTEKPLPGKRAVGITLPSIVLENRFSDWDYFLNYMRAPYRRRLQTIRKFQNELIITKLKCNDFSPEMYQQYLDVFKRSKDKLEKLEYEFFLNLPQNFSLTKCTRENRLLGWNISMLSDNTFYFFMGGIDYELNKVYQTYFYLLTELVREGIEKGVLAMDFGQTAEIPKMRLGGNPSARYMEAHHSNGLLHAMLMLSGSLLSYRKPLEDGRVFRDEYSA